MRIIYNYSHRNPRLILWEKTKIELLCLTVLGTAQANRLSLAAILRA